ncbi:hypothetical protein L873DRAFT_262041 [Choiromyces venosus 120613-1]|uniref:Small RNA 2'-O-methyltransferase n=1 Tax=Choiromyces venosus 120613-1 TaxID=1336337 RepID=A0A3N4J473_9PEZI|nr:hypothetical protein L873DRAFT_262041 [Choiromyces venosus 120613-1]
MESLDTDTGKTPPTTTIPVPLSPHIVFTPPQYFQRRFSIHSILRKYSTEGRFAGGLQSLLDVGCGSDILLLRSLIPCEEDLPIEMLTGIDIDGDIRDPWCIKSDFQYLSPYLIPRHDIIVSSEVIEHLDPEPLSIYADTLLGAMKPKICIITTPNRDFNPIFDINFAPQDKTGDSNKPDNRKFWRTGIPYRMRHHDHRFEWTRSEFRAWAREAAARFGYTVKFTGVGSFGYSMMIENVDPAVIEQQFKADMSLRTDTPEDPGEYFSQEPVQGELAQRAHRVYGDCTQIAVFIIQPEGKNGCVGKDGFGVCDGDKGWVSLSQCLDRIPALPGGSGCEGISLVKHVSYPFVSNPYPPPVHEVLFAIKAGLNQFIPAPVYDHWSNPPTAVWDKPRETVIVELDSLDEDPVLKRKRVMEELKEAKEYMKKLLQGKNLTDLEVLVVPVDVKRIWESDWKLQHGFRFCFEVFRDFFGHVGVGGVRCGCNPPPRSKISISHTN